MRVKLAHPQGAAPAGPPPREGVDQDYPVTGETARVRENGETEVVGVLATYAYDI